MRKDPFAGRLGSWRTPWWIRQLAPTPSRLWRSGAWPMKERASWRPQSFLLTGDLQRRVEERRRRREGHWGRIIDDPFVCLDAKDFESITSFRHHVENAESREKQMLKMLQFTINNLYLVHNYNIQYTLFNFYSFREASTEKTSTVRRMQINHLILKSMEAAQRQSDRLPHKQYACLKVQIFWKEITFLLRLCQLMWNSLHSRQWKFFFFFATDS